jgi:predicted secreted acid phosphatase
MAIRTCSSVVTLHIVVLAVGCGSGTARLSEPPNVGDAKVAATRYHDSGAYERDLATVTRAAEQWLAERAPNATRPAIVFDIDETALSNWTVILADDYGRIIPGSCDALPSGPCGWAAWDMRGSSTTLSPTLALYRRARALNVSVFFISGRPESQRGPTEQNLRQAGYGQFSGLVMTQDGAKLSSAADFKAPARAAIQRAGYTIIANVGDQPSDLEGGYAERTFLLPNPFYRIP